MEKRKLVILWMTFLLVDIRTDENDDNDKNNENDENDDNDGTHKTRQTRQTRRTRRIIVTITNFFVRPSVGHFKLKRSVNIKWRKNILKKEGFDGRTDGRTKI